VVGAGAAGLVLVAAFLFVSSARAQSGPDVSLAPFRSAAHAAFAAEMAAADRPLCPGLVAAPEFAACLDASLKQSEKNLAAYRAALRSSIVARQTLLGAPSLDHFRSAELMWDQYSEREVKASGDMAGGPELIGSAEEGTRIDLIRMHMRALDRIYYTLLHDDCGACLVDH
jgi:hypothetical protein